MREGGIRDDVAPWSFFLPVTLAVIVGGVAAGLIGRGIDAVFGPGEAPRPIVAAPAPPSDPVQPAPQDMGQADTGGPAGTSAGPVTVPGADGDAARSGPGMPPVAGDVSPNSDIAAIQDGTSAPPESAAVFASTPDPAVPVLPGAIVARRDGAPEACINGTIATRDANGWQQRLENDAPVACTEQSTAPP